MQTQDSDVAGCVAAAASPGVCSQPEQAFLGGPAVASSDRSGSSSVMQKQPNADPILRCDGRVAGCVAAGSVLPASNVTATNYYMAWNHMWTKRENNREKIRGLCLVNFLFTLADSIHVSIHYPKGGKKPEVLVSEGPKGKIIKDVKVIQTGAVPDDYDATRPLHNPPRGGAVSAASASRRREDNPRLIYPEDVPFSSPYPSKPKLVVPTETEQYHMKIAAQKYKERRQPHEGQKHKQTVLKLTKKARKVAPPLDLEDSKQDDHRRYWKGAVKKAYTSYKNLPLSRRERRKPVRPVVPSRQTYDLTRIKEYERLRGRGAARRRADAAAEYKEGAVEERLPERYDPGEYLTLLLSLGRTR